MWIYFILQSLSDTIGEESSNLSDLKTDVNDEKGHQATATVC